jgi:hypothetical protein
MTIRPKYPVSMVNLEDRSMADILPLIDVCGFPRFAKGNRGTMGRT